MRSFTLKEWLQSGKKLEVVTEDNMPVKIIYWNRKIKKPGEPIEFPIVALTPRNKYDLNEQLLEVTEDGCIYTPSYGYKPTLYFNDEYIVEKWSIFSAKRGDILATDNKRKPCIFVFDGIVNGGVCGNLCYIGNDGEDFIVGKHNKWLFAKEARLATPDERNKLFAAMSCNGYRKEEFVDVNVTYDDFEHKYSEFMAKAIEDWYYDIPVSDSDIRSEALELIELAKKVKED